MRRNFPDYAVFAVLLFLIPLLALRHPIPLLELSSAAAQDTPAALRPTWTADSEHSDSGAGEPPQPSQVVQADDRLRILDEQTGEIFTVSGREFVRGALAAEMPPTFHPEAMKAQAVAAHTYALACKAQNTGKAYDLTADPQNWRSYTTEQVFRERYGSYADAYWKAICSAADPVAAYLLIWEGEPIVAAYHSMSSGVTEDASNVWQGGKPYLVPVESTGDPLAPDYETHTFFPVEQVAQAVRSTCPSAQLDGDPSGWFEITERSEGGYVTGLLAGGQNLSGTRLRSLLGLRSADFDISCDGTQFCFTVRGYGHGVGLSQYGADYMARQGATFDEILLHYYTGATLAVIS